MINFMAFLIFFPCLAHAYLDPGTGGFLIQILLGGLAGAATVIKLYWHKIKGFFKRK